MIVLALTLAALAATASATGYIDGREYVYSYKGHIYTGFPNIKPQYTEYNSDMKLIVQPHGEFAYLKLDNAQTVQSSGEYEDVAHHPLNYSHISAHAAMLTTPFKVYRKNGIVTHFEVSKGELPFFINLKRGFIVLFNLNFDEVEGPHSIEDNDINKPFDPDRHYYRTFEKGVLGDCETSYIIEHHPYYKSPHNNIVLNVTKTRNYHKCNTSHNHVYGIFHGHECGKAEHEKSHTLHGNAEFRYNIRGYRHHYVIEKITSIGEVVYTPYPVEGQTVSTTMNREFELIEERPATTPLELDADTEVYTSLENDFGFQKNFKDAVDLKKPHYLYHLTARKVSLDVIRGQFDELINVYDDDTYREKIKDKNFPAKFVELLRSLGSVGYEEIEDLYKAYGDIPNTGATDDQKKYRSLFVDALVHLGTNPAIHFADYLIENKKVKPQEASYFFSHLPLHVKEVSETLLAELQVLCEHESVKKHQHVHIACVLGFSTVVYDHCVAKFHPEVSMPTGKHRCQPEDVIKFFDYVAKHFEETEDETLKIAYLKAAGNMGLREILPYIRPYIEGVGNPHPYLRSTALWAVLKVGFRFPDNVRDLLVPVLFNQTEKHEIRLDAFNILLIYRPELFALEGLARVLKNDPDDQVRSFVYSTLQHLVNSTHPCDRQLSKDAHYALRILEEVHHEFENYDYSYSHDHYVAGYDPDYDFGGSSRFAYYASNTGYIPQTIYLGLEDFIGGKSFQSLGIGFKQYGLEKFVDKLLGPEGSFGRRSMFDLFKKRDKRNAAGSVKKELNEIKGKIHLPVIDYEPIHGDLFFTYMGSNLAFLHFDDSTFEDFFKEGRFSIPNLPALYQKVPSFVYQRFMLNVDKSYVIPSESGIPFIFDYKQPFYFYHKNKESSLKVEPGFFPEDRAGKWPDHVKVETDGHIACDKNLFASMSVIIPFDQIIFGAGINRRSTLSLPLKLKLDLDVKDKSLHTKWTPVAPHEVYHFKYEPYTFVDSYMNSVPMSLEERYRPVKRLSQKHAHKHLLYDALGVGFDVHVHYENDFNDVGSWIDFLLDKDYREKFYYLYANPHFEPYNVDVEFAYAKEGATKEVESKIKYNYYDEEHVQPEFTELHFEDYKISSASELAPFCTCALEFELVGHGDKERKLHADLSWTRDLKRTYHKLNFFYDRSPFFSSETHNLKVCGSGFLRYPIYDYLKLATFDTLGMDHTVNSEMKVLFGKDCSTDQTIKVSGEFKTTEEQRELESKREVPDTPEHYNLYAQYYQGCLKEQEMGIYYGENWMKYVEYISTVREYNFHAKHENLSPGFLNFTYKVGGFLRHVLYDHADHNTIDVENPADEFHLHANFSTRLPIVDIRTLKPKSISHYTHVYDPYYKPLRSLPLFEDFHVKNSISDIYCKIEGEHVHTFDRYEYKLPPIDCYKVIAKDCSPIEHFTVLGTKITHSRHHTALKVFLGKHKIEALPVSDDSDIIIKVDGKRVEVTDSHPYLHHEGEGHNSHVPDFYITFRKVYYALHSEKYGLIVEYDGSGIMVQVSPFFRNKLCGLCGNYNGLKYDGTTTPEGCYYEDEKAYAYAYAIPSDTCSVPHFELKCPSEGGFGCTKLRTRVIDRTIGKVSETCFSTDPVAECSSHCKARQTDSQTLSFHCLPAADDFTKALVRQAQNRIIHEVRRKSKDHEASVDVPDVCLKA